MDGQVIPQEIRKLLEKRLTFQEWLSRLDELGGNFRPEVSGKVRVDYTERLGRVEEELGGHRTVLEASLSERRDSLQEISGRHDARTAELEECELRHQVGEYDDGEFDSLRQDHQGVLDELNSELASQRAAVAELEGVLSELSGTAEEPAAAPPVFTRVEDAAEAIVQVSDEQPDAVDVAEKARPAGTATLDEQAVMEQAAVVEDETPLEEALPGEEEAGLELPVDEKAGWERERAKPGEASVESLADGDEDAEPAVDLEPTPVTVAEDEEYMDELEFLESLSLDDADNFDAVSAMLESDDEDEGKEENDAGEEPAEGQDENEWESDG
jgi:hypothetical protein